MNFAVIIGVGGYCAFDLALVLDIRPTLVPASIQIALAFGAAHGVAWLLYFAAAERRPLRRAERALAACGVIIALSGLVPGLLVTKDVVAIPVSRVGVTYHTPQPTALGLVIVRLLLCRTGGHRRVLVASAPRPWA